MASATSISAHPDRPKIQADLRLVAQQIHEEFDDRVDPHEVDKSLDRVIAQFADVKVHAFVPLLVRRYVRAELHSRL